MSVFALSDGRLVEAPTYSQFSRGLIKDILHAVQSQTLALIQRPLFPIGYVTNQDSGDPKQSLIALDSDKRVVTIEVVDILTAASLVQASARAGKFSSLSRQQLVDFYPGTEQDFAHRWGLFIDSTAPSSQQAPRLYIFCQDLDDEARNSLSGVDVDVKLIVAHEGANGTLIEVVDVDQHLPHVINQPQAPWMISAGSSSSGEEAENLLDQSLWDIQGWAERPSIPPLPYHQAVAQQSQADNLPTEQPDFILPDSEDGVREASEEAEVSRFDTAIMLAELTEQPSRRSRRARRRATAGQTESEHVSVNERDTAPASTPHLPKSKSGTVLYEQLLERTKRAEQRLWDRSAPQVHTEKTIFSEEKSANMAARAVAEAAEKDCTKLAEWITIQRAEQLASNNKPQPARRRRSRRH
ncbi:hypothetical protein [Arcanobacterium phocae]|uniref:hypothetical protein n=1 Tax=Arcanobacterium phocae TaxID=131112 RepID=UPI001C0F2EF1|nr:hypothetical protein [Arcanobacterium phocae]